MDDDLPPLPPTTLGRYRHYKGGEYEVIGVARHSETLAPMVIYRPLYNATGWWARPHDMFFGSVVLDGQAVPRFARIEPAAAGDAAKPVALAAREAPARVRPSNYPEPFASRMAGRLKRPLGELFGLKNFGVNLTRLAPGAVSALRHSHTRQDEFVYVIEGTPTLHTDAGATRLQPGDCAGFAAGTGDAHCLRNDTPCEVLYLEVGDRTPGDEGHYPDDDLRAERVGDGWRFLHKDGTPYG